jgi:hypothetical protein
MAKLEGHRERVQRGRSGVEVEVHPTAEAASRAGAESFVEHARRAIAARGRFDVALSGGDTPRRMYEMLAEEIAIDPRGELAWVLIRGAAREVRR